MIKFLLIATLFFAGCALGEYVDEGNITVYNITTIETEPWIIKRKSMAGGQEKISFEGFGIDVLEELAKKLNFRYQIHLVEDGMYGYFDTKRNSWVGMIGELLDGKADIAVAPLSITTNREEVVNFTKPVMSSGYNVLIKRPIRLPTNVLFLLYPFEYLVWILLFFLYGLFGLLLCGNNRFNPYEWGHVAVERDVRGAKYSFNLTNSFVFVASAITLQGYRELPKSYTGRVLAITWWAFSFAIAISYVANLAAILVTQEPETAALPFKTIDQMVEQSDIVYGVARHGRVMSFLRNSGIQAHKDMLSSLTQRDTLFSDTEDAVRHVENGGAAIIEKMTGEYITGSNCGLMLLGESLFPDSYGFAMKPALDIKDNLNVGILELMETGKLHMLKKKWWKRRCPVVDESMFHTGSVHLGMRARGLTFTHLSFGFICLLIGVVLAVLTFIGEIYSPNRKTKSWTLWKRKKATPEETPLDKIVDVTLTEEDEEKKHLEEKIPTVEREA